MLKTIGGANNELLGATSASAKGVAKEGATQGPSMIVLVSLMVLIAAGIAFAMVRWQADGRLTFLEDSRKTIANDLEAVREGLAGVGTAAPAAGVEELKLRIEALEMAVATSTSLIASNTLAIGVLTAKQSQVLPTAEVLETVPEVNVTVSESQVNNVPVANSLCTDMAKTVSGRTRMPIAPKYGNLDILGQIFTAADCGEARLGQITWLEDSPKGGQQYSFGLNINLKNPASPELLAQLLILGFDCETKTMFAVCRDWVANKVLTVADLQKLQPFVAEIDTDSSLR